MAHLLGAEALHLEYPNKVVFDSVSLGLNEGDRVGIVGRNGDGKSTLLGMLAGRTEPDSGRVTVRGGVTIGVLDQADTLDDALTVGAAVVGDREEYEWAGDPKVRDVISGLLSDLEWNAPVKDLSGGQRRRVSLAALLAGDWDVLALDEPTNHLDVEAISWLAQHLKRRWHPSAGGLLVVTHDRWFLDEVCTATWEVHDRIVEPFEGGYAAYMLQRVERDRQAAAVEQRRQNLARKELAWLRRGAPARTSKPKFRIEAANELIADVPEIRDAVSLQALAVSRLGKDVVDLLDAGVRFGDREVLKKVEWRLAPGERTGVLGPNGAGKSTLLSLISGTLEPTSGKVKRGTTVKVATLTQRIDELDAFAAEPVRKVLEGLRTSYTFGAGSKASELSPGQLLERLGFASEQLSTPVKDLSGGQKRRLQLLLILLEQPNVLILDEPTNDLDTDMLAAMEDLLDTWPGTLIVVSHDRYFLERVTDQQFAVLDSRLRHLPGGVDQYLQLRAQGVGGSGTDAGAPSGSPLGSDGGAAVIASGPSEAERREARKALQRVNRRLEKAQEEVAGIDAELAAAAGAMDFERVRKIDERRQALSEEIDGLEEEWMELAEVAEN
ncbi:ABC-F family ATP-binding cassette domain-containing protein [Galactobacter valiniphilus]|uniref:ABC-F family ATP-binding cassette domain-containing protein n=1 Tax=Galactobacter valiniphilus TaxID=2676122 RepID=UPI0037352E8E